ncbi:unnamed protein product [Cuscuta epithymum]|uniref:3-ketoacyl-CoA synthase n=1 Tax=Cuscuta epithymum TaxID=186058 RepID=A0AAV0EN97_9ASTE|nr:unnamed protein product [Cuscuta epithymum]
MVIDETLLSTEIVNRGVDLSGPDAGARKFSVRVRRRLPDFVQSVNLKYVKLGYYYMISNGMLLAAAALPLLAVVFGMEMSGNLGRSDFVVVIPLLGLLSLTLYVFYMSKSTPIYLVDFACCKPNDDLKVTKDQFIDIARKSGTFKEESLEYMKRLLESSGIGDETYVPKSIGFPEKDRMSLNVTRAEASMVVFDAIDVLFEKTGIKPKDIGVLVVNCSTFNPTPSLSAMIINRYKMRVDILSSNLGGMGCSAGIIALDLAQDILRANPNRSIYQDEDDQNKKGLKIDKSLVQIGGEALKENLTTLGPMVLPFTEQFYFFKNLIQRKLTGAKIKPYIPNYTLAFTHLCINAASKTLLDELKRNLNLTEENMEASRATLHRFGNTSSSSIWYELAYLEAKDRVKPGNRVLQLQLGSGFKCNSISWVALNGVRKSCNWMHNPWIDCIDRYPQRSCL